MSLLQLLGAPAKELVGAVGSVIDKLHTSDEEKAAAKFQLATLVANFEQQVASARRDVLVAEAKGESWMQRNWRPITMLTFVFIIFNNYVLAPYVAAFGGHVPTLDIPNGMWALLNVGIGGYIASRGVEKVVAIRANGKAK